MVKQWCKSRGIPHFYTSAITDNYNWDLTKTMREVVELALNYEDTEEWGPSGSSSSQKSKNCEIN